MHLWKIISFLIFVVIVLALAGVSIFLILDGDVETITDRPPELIFCESGIYPRSRLPLDSDYSPHFLKNIDLTLRLPPVEVDGRSRATRLQSAWLTQRLDHFNPTDLRTWQMRYLINSEFYEDGGPIFVFIGGEGAIIEGYLLTGQLYDMAVKHKGYMFYTEHRYYGQSMPTENLCTENLQYLNADQALADIVYFIDYQKQSIPSLRNSKVVVVGGSYAATLATWARIKYPHTIDAALSSSAPLLAIADFYQYYEVVSDNLQKASDECGVVISEAITEIEELLKTSEGITKVSEEFRTCQLFNTTEPNRAYFFAALTTPFASLVQYAAQGQIYEQCSTLTSFNGTSYEKFQQYIDLYYTGYCIANYDYYVKYLDYPAPNGIARQWMYQTCTEYGFYQTTNSDRQYFGKNTVNLNLYQRICNDVFGIDEDALDMLIERTNYMYGALEPEVTKVVSVHGTVDPWHSIGVLADINEEAPVIVVDGTSHCADLLSVSTNDLPDMITAKTRAKELIANWIK